MAYIPDDSFKRRLTDRLSPILWEFYQYLCLKRNHETRLSPGRVDDFIELYGYGRASKFNLLKELRTTRWIGGEEGRYELLVGDFSVINRRADERKRLREQTVSANAAAGRPKNFALSSKKMDEKSKNLDAPLKDNQLSDQEFKNPLERDREPAAGASAGGGPGVTAAAASGEFESGVEETLRWVMARKGLHSLNNFPAARWRQLLDDLRCENIDLEAFRDFYRWVENLDWVSTVSPQLLRGQIEKFQKRRRWGAKSDSGIKNYENAEAERGNSKTKRNGRTERDIFAESAEFYAGFPDQP